MVRHEHGCDLASRAAAGHSLYINHKGIFRELFTLRCGRNGSNQWTLLIGKGLARGSRPIGAVTNGFRHRGVGILFTLFD